MKSKKTGLIAALFLLLLGLTACSSSSDKLAAGFIPYRSAEICKESPNFAACKEGISSAIKPFRIKYPADWEIGWFADGGVTALLIASGDINDAWIAENYDEGLVMILPGGYGGSEGNPLDEFVFKEGEVVSGPTRTEINGADTNMVIFIDEGLVHGEPAFNIEYTVVYKEAIFHIIATAPLDKETEYRPYLEAIVSTLEFE